MLGDYAVAVNLALKNNVSRGLAAITSEFVSLNRGIAGAQGNLDTFHRKVKEIKTMGMIGAGIAGFGVGSLMMLKGPYEDAKRLEQAKTDFENLNLSASDNSMAFAQAAANAHKVLGSNITDNIKQINDLHTAFGDLHHALRSSEAYAQYTFAAKIANGGVEVPGLANDSVRALEQRGGKVINDDATFLQELKMQSKVHFGTRGKVSGKDFFAASQTGGMAYTLLDKEYLYGEFAALMQAKSGATAGTSLMTGFSSLIGGHMDNKAKGFLADLGMLQVGVSKAQVQLVNQAVKGLNMPDKEKHQLMKAMMPVTGGLKDQFLDVAAHRPDILVNDYLVPAIRQKFGMNMTDEQIGQLVTAKFNRGSSKELGELIVNHLKFVKDADIFTKAKDYGGAYKAYLKSPEGAETAAGEAWKNLSTMIGVTYIPKITEGLGSLALGLDRLSTWTQQHPNLTKDLTYGFIALGSAMAIGGTLTLVTAAFKGLGLALDVATLGGAGSGIATLAAKGLGGVLGGALKTLPALIESMGGTFIVLSSAASLAIAGAVGYALGTVVSKAIDMGIQQFKGHENDTLGTAFYNWVHDPKGMDVSGLGKFKAPYAPGHEPADYRDPTKLPSMPPQNSSRHATMPPARQDGANSNASGQNATPAPPPVVNVHASITLDGKELSSHMVATIMGGETTGPSGINTSASRLHPSMGSYGLPNVA